MENNDIIFFYWPQFILTLFHIRIKLSIHIDKHDLLLCFTILSNVKFTIIVSEKAFQWAFTNICFSLSVMKIDILYIHFCITNTKQLNLCAKSPTMIVEYTSFNYHFLILSRLYSILLKLYYCYREVFDKNKLYRWHEHTHATVTLTLFVTLDSS